MKIFEKLFNSRKRYVNLSLSTQTPTPGANGAAICDCDIAYVF